MLCILQHTAGNLNEVFNFVKQIRALANGTAAFSQCICEQSGTVLDKLDSKRV